MTVLGRLLKDSLLGNWRESFLPNVFGNRYETVRRNLTDRQVTNAITRILESDRFDVGEYSHIVLKNTDTIVGYIGNETLELYCPENSQPAVYRTPHKHLRRIFRSC